MVDRLHGKIESHELDDRTQATECGANANAGKTVFGDRRIDDPLGAEFLKQPLADFIGTLVFSNLLTHQENRFVAPHFFSHGIAKRFAYG